MTNQPASQPEKPKTQLQAVLEGRCPRCRVGKIFPYHPYNPSHILHYHKKCTECNLNIEKEPGFLYGAMYLSYAFNVGLMIVFGFGAHIIFGDSPVWVYLVSVFGAVFLFFPLNYRYSRILYMYLFGGFKFDEEVFHEVRAKKQEEK